ncbi:MAG: asparagine synthase (glutamine-hydrolyzing) [Candidatus Woesearchaeota archaeon]|jgi:asparagine synthase (glutamine-hydrolysing)
MCGINGFSFEDKKLIQAMNHMIHHRGPDQQGTFVEEGISLGHQRLSIIDLTENGKQPMFNEDGNIVIVFNGEIYNFKEIKSLLIKKHHFCSESDTEVIIHGYEEFGIKGILSRLRGMYAFALFDCKKKKMFLVRDEVGVKPLYYTFKNKEILFSSEIKSLFVHGTISRELDPESVHQFLTFRYVPGQKTIFRDIFKVLPGNYLEYDLKERSASLHKFWEVEYGNENLPLSEAATQLNSKLTSSVKDMLISDVPLGAFLSGGLDSSYIVGIMSKLSSQPINTFSVGFDIGKEFGKKFDETDYAAIVATHFKTNHHVIKVGPESVDVLPQILYHLDEPIADAATVPFYHLSAYTKKYVTVVLTGEGSDELLGGYSKYRYMKLKSAYDQIPHLIRKQVIGKVLSTSKNQFHQRMGDFSSSSNLSESYLNLISFFTQKEKELLLTQKFKDDLSTRRPDINTVKPFFTQNKILYNALMNLDFKTWMVDDVLMKVDKMTMSAGLESRVPFLDKDFVKFAASLSPQLKIRWAKEKLVLRKAMHGLVPKEIASRKKHGFNVPIEHWLDHELKDVVKNVLSPESVKKVGIFNSDQIEKYIQKYRYSKKYYSRQLWILTNFMVWHKIYIESDKIDKNKYKTISSLF